MNDLESMYFNSYDLKDFMIAIKKDNWVKVLCYIRSNRTYAMNKDHMALLER